MSRPESKPETAAAAATTPPLLDNHVREWARTLRKNKVLLELSSEALLELLPYLGGNGPATIADEIKYLSGRIHLHSITNRYNGIRAPQSNYTVLWKDVRKLAFMPGAALEATKLVIALFEYHIWYVEARIPAAHYRIVAYVCGIFDQLLRNVLAIMKARWQPCYNDWSPQQTLNDIQAIRAKNFDMVQRMALKKKVSLTENPIFTGSVVSLQRGLMRHSQKVGVMLATRATGAHLPPELVEMISDQFWDRDLLTKLDADDARLQREEAEKHRARAAAKALKAAKAVLFERYRAIRILWVSSNTMRRATARTTIRYTITIPLWQYLL